MSGIQVSGIHAGGECVYGLQAGGIFAMAEKATGIELAGGVSMCRDFRGAQLAGLLSQAESCCGLQLAFYTGSASMCGVQVGVMNFAVPAKDGWVVQLGLVNGIGKDEKRALLQIVENRFAPRRPTLIQRGILGSPAAGWAPRRCQVA